MAQVPTYPIVYQLGDSLLGISWTWKGIDGVPKNLTGYSASLAIYAGAEDTDPALEFTDDTNGGLTIDGVNGKVTLQASPAIIQGLAAGTNYLYILKVTSSDNTIVKTLTKGPFRVDGLSSIS